MDIADEIKEAKFSIISVLSSLIFAVNSLILRLFRVLLILFDVLLAASLSLEVISEDSSETA